MQPFDRLRANGMCMSNLWDLHQLQPRTDIVVPGDTIPAMFWNAVQQRGDAVFMRQKKLGLWQEWSWNRTAAAVRETCDDAAVYFDPLNAGELSARMHERIELGRISPAEQEKQRQRLATYSWSKSAAAMLEFLAKPAPYDASSRPTQ